MPPRGRLRPRDVDHVAGSASLAGIGSPRVIKTFERGIEAALSGARLTDLQSEQTRGTLYSVAPWHFLNFLPDPHGQGSFRPTVDQSTFVGTGAWFSERVRPAPTTIGSRRATTSFFGGSSGAISITSSAPLPLPFSWPSPFELCSDS